MNSLEKSINRSWSKMLVIEKTINKRFSDLQEERRNFKPYFEVPQASLKINYPRLHSLPKIQSKVKPTGSVFYKLKRKELPCTLMEDDFCSRFVQKRKKGFLGNAVKLYPPKYQMHSKYSVLKQRPNLRD